MAAKHTDSTYEQELRTLKERLLVMAGRVEEMIGGAIRALTERDAPLAERVRAADRFVNRDEVDIDDQCLSILARRQPMASDLRFITRVLKMVTDLERIGDRAFDICRRAIQLAALPPVKPYVDIPAMGTSVRAMVHDAIEAFIAGDAAQAEAVLARDDEVDDLHARIDRDLVHEMIADRQHVEAGLHIQAVARDLERIGDHATNLAEQVIFMTKGQDVRHRNKLAEP